MPAYVLRLWIPDRPGALGAVASRIGAVRGDVVGIEILERGAGRAIDELVVELPDEDLVSLLVREVGQVDGVDVEDVRPAPHLRRDPRLDALATAARPVSVSSADDLVDQLGVNCARGWLSPAHSRAQLTPTGSRAEGSTPFDSSGPRVVLRVGDGARHLGDELAVRLPVVRDVIRVRPHAFGDAGKVRGAERGRLGDGRAGDRHL